MKPIEKHKGLLQFFADKIDQKFARYNEHHVPAINDDSMVSILKYAVSNHKNQKQSWEECSSLNKKITTPGIPLTITYFC